MKRIIIIFLLISGVCRIEAQVNTNTVKIFYETRYHGQVDSSYYTLLEISGDMARISYHEKDPDVNAPLQNIYLDYKNNSQIRTAELKDGQKIHTIQEFTLNDNLTFLPETEEIAGYLCKKAMASINSNTIEIWYTTALKVKGTMQPGVGIPDGVVLKVVRNGQAEEKAVKVELIPEKTELKPDLSGEALTAVDFNYRIQQSMVVTISVFDRESIYFRDIPKINRLIDTAVMRFAHGSILLKKVTLPENSEDFAIFAELSQFSEGDAYDRTGSVFMISDGQANSFLNGLLHGKDALPFYTDKHGNRYEGMVAAGNYEPPLELMRFYTSFGVRGFNRIHVAGYHWPDSVIFKQEITDYAKRLRNEVWIGVWIGNYSQNGHNVSLKLKYYPNDPQKEKEVFPLFTTVNILEMAGQAYPAELFRDDSLTVKFSLTADLKNASIRYVSTGHGGWGGGDEFNPKTNHLLLDGHNLMAYTPWREDCGSYRELNPASGNFSNGLSSSDLSRSGWCPGTVSYPVIVHIGDMKAGDHELKVAIPVGKPEGNSLSYWCLSGTLTGELK